MDRRIFLKNGAAAGMSVGLIAAVACQPGNEPASAAGNDASGVDNFPLAELTVGQLQEKYAAGAWTAVQVTQWYLERIAAIDQAGPRLNSVVELNPDALDIAAGLDKERLAGKVRGPLHGVPVMIKENIDTADKMQTTAGSLALAGNIAAKDAFIVQKLRDAGAVILGKTNLSEWANFRSTSSCSGWSSRGGQTKCPYVLDHNPCGSSSGSGVAVSANLCMVAIGTETDGSVTCPASVNGLAGLKPTVGLWSRSGIIPISATQDTAGPMARTVQDVAVMLGLLVGEDKADPVTAQATGKTAADYTTFLHKEALKGKRIGVDLKKKTVSHQLAALREAAIQRMQQLGAEVVEVEYVESIDALGNYETAILQYEFRDGVNKYLAGANAPVKNLDEVIAYNKANEDKAMPFFKQEQLENCAKKGGLQEKEYLEALARGRDAARNILDTVMKKHQLDALAGITMGPGCSIDLVYGDRYSNDFLTQPAAMAGYPHISVPCGLMHRLPVGFSFFGAPFTEGPLLGMAYAFEQASPARPLPAFIPSFLDEAA